MSLSYNFRVLGSALVIENNTNIIIINNNKINTFDNIFELAIDGTITKILSSQNNSILY